MSNGKKLAKVCAALRAWIAFDLAYNMVTKDQLKVLLAEARQRTGEAIEVIARNKDEVSSGDIRGA